MAAITYLNTPTQLIDVCTPTFNYYNLTEAAHLEFLNKFSEHYSVYIQPGRILDFYIEAIQKILILAIEFGSSALIFDEIPMGSALTLRPRNISLSSFYKYIRKTSTLTNFCRVYALYSRTFVPTTGYGYSKTYGINVINNKVASDFADGAPDLNAQELAIILSAKNAEYQRALTLSNFYVRNPTLRFPNEPLLTTSKTLTHNKVVRITNRVISKFHNFALPLPNED